MNGREKQFKEGIANDEKYKKCLEKLKEYANKESNKEKVIKYNKNNNNKKEDIVATTQIVQIQQRMPTESSQKSVDKLISPKNPDNNENPVEIKKEIKGSLLQIFKYSSVRYICIILSVGWFCNSTLFYGLVIGIKTLKGSQYRNTAILYLCDFCAYNISGFFSNSKLGRKLSLQIFTLGYGIFCLVMFLVFDKNKDVVVGFYFCARLFMICGFCVYYSYAFESYPISVATFGYSFNATCSAVAGVVIPFIIEYIEEKYVFLIYAIEGVLCTLLFIFLKETRGKEREDNIKEIEEQINKEIEKNDEMKK